MLQATPATPLKVGEPTNVDQFETVSKDSARPTMMSNFVTTPTRGAPISPMDAVREIVEGRSPNDA